MAYSVREERQSLANSLREDLAQAERVIVQVRRDNVAPFLQLLDRIEDRFGQLEASGVDLRPEYTRWTSLHSKLQREAGRVVRAANLAGGLEKLRQNNAPARGAWWHLDTVVAANRRHLIRRLSISVGTIAILLVSIWALLTYVFPPDPNTVIVSEATSSLQQLAFEGRWQEALAVIDEAKAQLTEADVELGAVRLGKLIIVFIMAKAQLTEADVELLIWEAVIAEKVGQTSRAQEALTAAKARIAAGQQSAYLWTLGSIRLSVGDVEEARAAGDEALALDPNDPQGYFLLASVAELEGDTITAIDLLEKTFELAADGNPQLAVIARVRMGNLLQSPAGAPFSDTSTPRENEGSQQ